LENSRLSQALANWPSWPLGLTRPPTVVGTLSGFTNQGVVLNTGDQLLVLRLNRIGAESLGISRDQEYQIWQSVANLGVAPRLIHIDPQDNYVLYQYIQGRVWTPNDLEKPAQIERLREKIHRFQDARIDLPARNYIHYLEHYWNQLKDTPVATASLVDKWQAFQPTLESLQKSDWQPVLSHHDLIPENIIDTSQQLYIVDWEYAALGHPDLDSCSIGEHRDQPIAQVVDWINHLWWLLVNSTDPLTTNNE
jgi:aminoglycoside phosphotransferase (APT) family kinase protein